jgi:hypothetical protein
MEIKMTEDKRKPPTIVTGTTSTSSSRTIVRGDFAAVFEGWESPKRDAEDMDIAAKKQPEFEELDDAKFRSAFIKAGSSVSDADTFFNRFEYAYNLRSGVYSLALEQGIFLLKKCKDLDASTYETIHKGTPFYWLGMAAFLVGDYQTATFFFDAAVSEDIRAGRDPVTNSSPAFKFIQIEGAQSDQAAKKLVESLQTRIEAAIADYNKRQARSSISALELSHIRENFLRPALSKANERWRSLATTLISYFLEWDYRGELIELRPGSGTAEPFFLHLFKGCVLFESLLKANRKNPTPANAKTLGKVLNHLSAELKIPSGLDIGGIDFPTVLNNVSSANDEITTAVKFAGQIRNTVGHDLGWEATFTRAEYDSLAAMVASACLHAIACLYR